MHCIALLKPFNPIFSGVYPRPDVSFITFKQQNCFSCYHPNFEQNNSTHVLGKFGKLLEKLDVTSYDVSKALLKFLVILAKKL